MEPGPREATAGKTELAELTIESPHREDGVFHLATPWAVLDWLHEALPENKADWAFVDLGAGKGRAVLAAARRPYRRVVGVEFASELADAARRLIASAEGLRAGSVEILHMDAAQYELPEGPVIVFLFDPFDSPVIKQVAASIARSYAQDPQPIVIAYLNPRYPTVFADLDAFTPVKPGGRPALLLRLFCPYDLELHATRECLPLWR